MVEKLKMYSKVTTHSGKTVNLKIIVLCVKIVMIRSIHFVRKQMLGTECGANFAKQEDMKRHMKAKHQGIVLLGG